MPLDLYNSSRPTLRPLLEKEVMGIINGADATDQLVRKSKAASRNDDNKRYTFPTDKQKLGSAAKKTNLSIPQVAKWFNNKRVRTKKNVVSSAGVEGEKGGSESGSKKRKIDDRPATTTNRSKKRSRDSTGAKASRHCCRLAVRAFRAAEPHICCQLAVRAVRAATAGG